MVQLCKRKDYGLKGRPKNLISPQAREGLGDDNPYDPDVINDPEVRCFPCPTLAEAEGAFEVIKEHESEERQVTFLDNYGRQIMSGNNWLFNVCEVLRAKSDYHTDLVIVLQLYDHRLPIKILCTHITFFSADANVRK